MDYLSGKTYSFLFIGLICIALIPSCIIPQSLDPNAQVEVIATGIQQPEGGADRGHP